MLDGVFIFSTSGEIVFTQLLTPTLPLEQAISLLNQLIGDHILSTRLGSSSTEVVLDSHVLEWRRDNERGFVFVAMYGAVLKGKLGYVGPLLDKLVKKWAKHLEGRKELQDAKPDEVSRGPEDWDQVFTRLLRSAEMSDLGTLKPPVPPARPDAADAAAEGVSQLKIKGKGKDKERPASGKGKKAAVSSDPNKKLSKSQAAALDRSGAGDRTEEQILQDARDTFLPTSGEVAGWDQSDEEFEWDEEEEEGDSSSADSNSWTASLRTAISQVSGNRTLTSNDLTPALAAMRATLESKNVASDVAQQICESVHQSLLGARMSTFSSVKSLVVPALESAITRVLTPTEPLDLLKMCKSRRSRPFVMAFVGINGVGKSTTLAKVAYYLKSHGHSPLIAACDTFRSGAVEQLRVHSDCLGVPLFQRGYAKSPSDVARLAIQHASTSANDCVLIDTAGRMQNNAPLMAALKKLKDENGPDVVCFVGEALVGNDGVNQLRMFSKALAPASAKTGVDCVVLTKFDAVSDKVGAAVTMCGVTGVQVAFVGTGQKYNHLRKLSAKMVVKKLFER